MAAEDTIGSASAPHDDDDEVLDLDVSEDFCTVCGVGGDLLCCDGCPRVYHAACLEGGVCVEDLGDVWFCPVCAVPDDAAAWSQPDVAEVEEDELALQTPPPPAPAPATQRAAVPVRGKGKGKGKGKAPARPTVGTSRGMAAVRPRCLVCGQHGSLVMCSTCPKGFHAFCLQRGPDDKELGPDWRCDDCQHAGSAEDQPMATGAEAEAEDEAEASAETAPSSSTAARDAYMQQYKAAGRSLSNVMPRTEQYRKRSVNGPSSALSSYLAEKGIRAPPRMARWRRRNDGEDGNGAAAADGADGAAAAADAGEAASPSAPKTRRTRKAAVAKASERVAQALARSHKDQGKGTDKEVAALAKGLSEGAAAAVGKGKGKGKKGQTSKRKRKRASGDDDGDWDWDYLPQGPTLCGTCGCKVPRGCLVCSKCSQLSSRANRKKGADKKRRRTKKATPGSLLHELLGSMSSLQELCIQVVVKYIDCVEAFGDIAPEARERICRIVCKHRQLNDDTIKLFLDADSDRLRFADCADVSPTGFALIPFHCPMLHSLELHHCGQLDTETFERLSEELRFLKHVTLLGCFRITDEALAQFCASHPSLETFCVSHADTVGPLTVESLVKHCQGLRVLELSHCRSVDDGLVRKLATLKNLESLNLTGCELLTDSGLLEPIAAFGQTLKALDVSGVRCLSDQFVGALSKVTGALEEVRMQELSLVTDDGLLDLFKKNNSLRCVDLTRCTTLTDDGIKPLFTACPRLQVLRLNSLDKLTADSFVELTKLSPDLQELDLSFCREITDELLLEICRRCTHLAKLSVWGCTKITEGVLTQTPRSVAVLGCSRIE